MWRLGTRTVFTAVRVILVVVLPIMLIVGACAGASAPEAPAGASAPSRAPGSGDPMPGGERTQPKLASGTPVSVRIPAIGVSSRLLELGVLADGSAETPADFDLAGWFADGGRPGERGPTVLLGHVDSTDGPAVFFRLRELRSGDVVEVGLAGGPTARYVVDRVEQVAKDEFPTFAVFGATSEDVVRLVTCAGNFVRAAGSYEDNLVVHARRA